MHAWLLLALVCGAAGVPLLQDVNKMPAIDLNIIEQINRDADATWVAGENEIFNGLTLEDVATSYLGWLGPDAEDSNVPVERHDDVSLAWIPRNFDSYARWPNYTHPIRNQGACGSCWAFGAAEAFSDRLAIATKGGVNKVLSPEDLVSCDTQDGGCRGGSVSRAWNFIKQYGLVTDTCFPYTAGRGKSPGCLIQNHTCEDGEPFQVYKVSRFFKLSTEKDIMAEISKNGPVEAGFAVFHSFFQYKSGVYVKPDSDTKRVGGHAIKIVGWGVEPGKHWWSRGTPYWLCANSWGTGWGMRGFFKILRGRDEQGHSMCNIEDGVMAGTPLL